MGEIKDYEKISKQALVDMLDRMYTQDIMNQMSIERLEKALDIACFELEEKDYKLFDLFNAYVYVYYDIRDRHEWKQELMDRVEELNDE